MEILQRNGTFKSEYHHKWTLKCQKFKSPWPYLVWYFVIHFCYIINFFMSLYKTLDVEMDGLFCKYACGHGPKDNCENLNHNWSIKWNYLAQFSIRWLYTQPEVIEIIFYHRLCTRINGELTHGKHDIHSITEPSFFAPQMSQALKGHI